MVPPVKMVIDGGNTTTGDVEGDWSNSTIGHVGGDWATTTTGDVGGDFQGTCNQYIYLT